MVPDVALAASARDWPDRLHRFLLDHGGGRVVDRVMGPDQATEGSFDVLLVDDVCSFLTPRLVMVIKQSGSEVIGVYAPEDGPDAKRRLLECGISDVIETEASPEEFLQKITATLAHRGVVPVWSPTAHTALRIAITGACDGVGMTEMAIALSRVLADDVSTTLIDMHPVWPSVAQRLDLPVHPNIRTALDNVMHRPDRLDEAVHQLDRLEIVAGRADGGQGPPISRPDAVMLMEALASRAEVVVADLGPIRQSEPGLVREFDSVIVVGTAGPVGIARLIKTVGGILDSDPSHSVLAVTNMIPRAGFRRTETINELGRTLPDVPVVAIPYDNRLSHASWDGTLAGGTAYRKAIRGMAEVVVRSLA
ncbi:MAG: hypothetical protein ACRDU9_01030 [Acidimicrobiia bacterium]